MNEGIFASGTLMRMKKIHRDAEILAVIDVLARLRTLQSIPWRCLSSLEGRRGLAVLATLMGAGMMGAMVFVKSISEGAFPWLGGKKTRLLEEAELTVPGLQNSGNNCFLNAILQALASSEKFAAYLKAYEYQDGDNESEVRLPSMPLSAALCDLLEELAEVAPGHRIVSPRRVMRVLGHYARSFDLAMQQDAAEALSYLAAALQHERREEFDEYKPSLQSLADVSVLTKHRQTVVTDDGQKNIALDCWRQQLRWPMEGTYGSLLACSQCGFQASMQFQFFRDVSLAIPRSAGGYIRNECTIEDCLDQFTTLERVSNFRCNRCAHLAAVSYLNRDSENNKEILRMVQCCTYEDNCSCELVLKERDGIWFRMQGDAYKCLRIGRCPEVLCLHLQRVMVNTEGQLEKLMGHVSFTTELDMYPFTLVSQQGMRTEEVIQTGISRYEIFNSRVLPGAVLKALDASSVISMESSKLSCVGGVDSGERYESSSENWQDLNESTDKSPEGVPDDLQHDEGTNSFGSEVQDKHLDLPIEQIGNQTIDLDEESTRSCKRQKRQCYDLISVVVHHGSPMSGHYTVYRKVKVPRRSQTVDSAAKQKAAAEDEQEEESEQSDEFHLVNEAEETIWFEISDADVVKVSEEQVLAARASLLFYELQ